MSTDNHNTAPQTLGFQTEVKELLHLMIHSLYSNKEIFLRELISNGSDACDKLRFEALNQGDLYGGNADLKIRISFDKAARTITVADNGIGLSRDEAILHLGTIAKSGTREFFAALTGDQAKDAHLIGQFGVGFYSSFIVADKVTVTSRRAGLAATEAVKWESAGAGDYTVETVEKADRGTTVTLHLKESEGDFLSAWHIKSIIRKYSDHITLPILMKKEEWKDGESLMTDEDETVNQASALWSRPKSDITEAQYQEFYKHVGHDFENPLCWTHARVEGKQEYTALLYLPAHAPFDLWDRQARHGIKLYVRRVFIMDDAEQLMPLYLRFVRGVVDAADLPLNVSREILQQSKDIDAIKSGSTRRVLSMLEDLAENKPEDYAKFWGEFGAVLKEGVGEDASNKEKIAALLRFATTTSEGETQSVSLKDYLGRMKEGQEKIYYVTAESFNAAAHSPHLEIFKKKGIEVLLLSERVDEWVVGHLANFEGKDLQSVAKGGLDLGSLEDDAEKKETAEKTDAMKDFLEKVGKVLEDKVKLVRLTHRLTDSPACLVSDEHDPSGNLARIMKASGQKMPVTKPILEINPIHPIIKRLQAGDSHLSDWSMLLFEQATLAEGGQLDDPAGFVKRVNERLIGLLG